MKLNNDLITKISPTICRTWSYIGSDAMEFCSSNMEAMEMILDANRMSSFCGDSGKEIEDLMYILISEHGYTKVLKFCSKNISIY